MHFQEDSQSLKPLKEPTREELQQEILQLKKSLAQTEERMDHILKATNDAVYEWNLLTGHLSWNEGFLLLIGYERESIEHSIDFWSSHLHPQERERVEASLQAMFQQGGQHWVEEYRFRRKDGSYAYVLERGYVIYDSQNKPVRMVGALQDVSRQKEAELALEAISEEYAFLLNEIPALVFSTRPDGQADFVNQQWLQYTGLSREEILGVSWAKAVYPLDREPTLQTWQKAVQQGINCHIQHRLRRQDGTYRWFQVNAVPYKDKEGKIIKWFGTCTDIEEVKQVQEALQQSMQMVKQAKANVEESQVRIRSILEGIPAMAWTTDIHGNNTYFNSHWYSYCGISPGKQVNTYEFIHPEDRPAIASSWQQAQSSKQIWQAEYRLLREDGTYRWHLGRTVPVFNSEGTLLEWFGVGTDIEEQKQTQKMLENTLAELHEKNFELDQFVYKTSHDLRAPLTTILGLVTIIRDETDEKTKMHYVDLIEGRVQKLDAFIKSMLDYSRNTRTPVKSASIQFQALIEECLQELASLRHFDRLRMSTQIVGENFYSDPFRLKIIFSNLISNAIKYQDFSKENSFLKIHIEISPSAAIIQFQDNGVGVKDAYQGNIFDMFFRATDQSEGSGLGLYIVKQAVAVLQGSITLESRPNEGTLFKLCLPQSPVIH